MTSVQTIRTKFILCAVTGSLSSEQKRETIHALKKQRKQDIKDLVANYHRQTSNEKPQAVE
jgi:hypothetical protein